MKEIAASTGWKKLLNQGQVTVFGKKDSKGNHYLKAVALVQAPVAQVFEYLQNRAGNFNAASLNVTRLPKQGDFGSTESGEEGHKIAVKDVYGIGSTLKMMESTDAYRAVWYSSFDLPWPLHNRDLCWHTHDCLLSHGHAACIGRSVRHTSVPLRPGFTRIDMKIGSLLNANEVNERHTDLVFVAQADLKGWIPGWALANAAGVQAYMVQRVQEHFTPTLTAEETTSLEQITAEWMIFMGAGRETVK